MGAIARARVMPYRLFVRARSAPRCGAHRRIVFIFLKEQTPRLPRHRTCFVRVRACIALRQTFVPLRTPSRARARAVLWRARLFACRCSLRASRTAWVSRITLRRGARRHRAFCARRDIRPRQHYTPRLFAPYCALPRSGRTRLISTPRLSFCSARIFTPLRFALSLGMRDAHFTYRM